MRFLAIYALLNHSDQIPQSFANRLRDGLITTADSLLTVMKDNAYQQPIRTFHWGSNSDVLNAGMILAQSYQETRSERYLHGVLHCLNYVFGCNGVGYSFVTGFGAKTPFFIHHRQSMADGIPEPIPGFLSGGPNFRKQDEKDGTIYPEQAPPMQCWVDQESSYASNEVCLNWNSALTYLLGFVVAELELSE